MRADRPYRGKRLFDLAVLVVLAPAAAAAGIACAIAVRLDGPGPILFRQRRTGMEGREFQVLKFRTMIEGDNPVFPDPTRITRTGRWLRRTSLDELPQLINVARGEMSLVGPRPTLPYQVERYDDRQRRRLRVRPGVTGLAQVLGRNGIPWTERIELDLRYLAEQSPATDLRILLRTATVVVVGGGVEGHPTDDPLAREPDGSSAGDTRGP